MPGSGDTVTGLAAAAVTSEATFRTAELAEEVRPQAHERTLVASAASSTAARSVMNGPRG